MQAESLRSYTLPMYDKWLKTATPEQVELVDAIYKECEDHYEHGGDEIVECMCPSEVLEEFESVKEAKEFCGIKLEQALNYRWGDDDDAELRRYERYKNW